MSARTTAIAAIASRASCANFSARKYSAAMRPSCLAVSRGPFGPVFRGVPST